MLFPQIRYFLILLLSLSIFYTTSLAQTPSFKCPIGYGAVQDRVVAISLKKYEALKPIATHQKKVIDSLSAVTNGLHVTIHYKDIALAKSDTIIATKEVLLVDSRNKGAIWKKKARNRTLLVVAEALLIVLFASR